MVVLSFINRGKIYEVTETKHKTKAEMVEALKAKPCLVALTPSGTITGPGFKFPDGRQARADEIEGHEMMCPMLAKLLH
jgi:hypothetical protein